MLPHLPAIRVLRVLFDDRLSERHAIPPANVCGVQQADWLYLGKRPTAPRRVAPLVWVVRI